MTFEIYRGVTGPGPGVFTAATSKVSRAAGLIGTLGKGGGSKCFLFFLQLLGIHCKTLYRDVNRRNLQVVGP